MGTRCLTVVMDEDRRELLCLYRQYDGFPDDHGEELASFLKGKKIVNGISSGKTNIANGMGCLAAQIVDHFKVDVGGVYLYPPGTNDVGEEYRYTVSFVGLNQLPCMQVEAFDYIKDEETGKLNKAWEVLFTGDAADFDSNNLTKDEE